MEGHSLQNATLWVEQLLLGTVGTVVAVLAVAMAGFQMLRGHLPAREGIRSVLGCFMLFGAPLIAQAIMGGLKGSSSEEIFVERPRAIPPAAAEVLPAPSPVNPFDPYTGSPPAH